MIHRKTMPQDTGDLHSTVFSLNTLASTQITTTEPSDALVSDMLFEQAECRI